MDSTYGTYVTDDLKMLNHRARREGIQHRHDIEPLDPKPGETVTVRAMTQGASNFTHAALYYTTNGSAPAGSRGIAMNGTAVSLTRARIEWDVPIWGYLIHWQGTIPGQPDGTEVQYQISTWSENGEELYADWPDVDGKVHHATMRHFNNPGISEEPVLTDHFPYESIFNYHVDTFEVPEWAWSATIYHVFLDRFYPGNGRDWLQPEDEAGIYGGTLWGLHDKLNYIADLGADCLWISPVWESPTCHGYDVTDYGRIEPRMGGEEALRAVIEGAHARGMRVLLDMVCNHLSDQHPIFIEAKENPNSPYRNWFFFDEYVPHGYKTFFNVADMPRLNLNYPPARDWMIENGVRWVRDFDVDGYRLDVADGPGPNFWSPFRKALRAVKPDCLIFGEIIDTPHRLRAYAGRLDGCLDFPFNDALRKTYAWETMSQTQLEMFIQDNDAFYPADFARPTFLDNHDMNRFSLIANNDREKTKAAVARHLALPQPVVIYNGTEIGQRQEIPLEEGGYWPARTPMVWNERQDLDLLEFYKAQIAIRKEQRQKVKGEIV